MNSLAAQDTRTGDMIDRLHIRQAVESWVLSRDQGDWDGLQAIWHEDGIMVATWFQGSAREFIDASRKGWERGSIVHHFLGGSQMQINEGRCLSETKVTLAARAPVHGVLCDVTCTGRFYDRFTKVGNSWLLLQRQVIYEKDRLDPVNHGERLDLDPELLNRFPQGYRHLAYMQVKSGQPVLLNLPGLRGEAVEKLYREGADWLHKDSGSGFQKGTYPTFHLENV